MEPLPVSGGLANAQWISPEGRYRHSLCRAAELGLLPAHFVPLLPAHFYAAVGQIIPTDGGAAGVEPDVDHSARTFTHVLVRGPPLLHERQEHAPTCAQEKRGSVFEGKLMSAREATVAIKLNATKANKHRRFVLASPRYRVERPSLSQVLR